MTLRRRRPPAPDRVTCAFCRAQGDPPAQPHEPDEPLFCPSCVDLVTGTMPVAIAQRLEQARAEVASLEALQAFWHLPAAMPSDLVELPDEPQDGAP